MTSNTATPEVQQANEADAQLLSAFNEAVYCKARIYSYDETEGGLTPAAYEALDTSLQQAEETIQQARASTIAGVNARLQLLLTTQDGSRWLDRKLAEEGFLAVYGDRDALDGTGQQLATAIFELMRIQWDAAVAAYQDAYATAEKVADFKEHLEMLMFARQGAGSRDKELEALNDRLDELQNHVSDHEALLKLIRTPVPDWQAYRLKAQLTNQEGYKDDAAEWLLRDVDALLGAKTGEA